MRHRRAERCDVPVQDSRRRFLPSVRNFFELYLAFSDEPCSSRLPAIHHRLWLVGQALLSKSSSLKFMKTSGGKPISLSSLDSAAFTEVATKAMHEAYLVAKKEAKRYGLKLVVARPPRKSGHGAW